MIALRDDLGTIVREVTLKRIHLDQVDHIYPDRWQYDIVVTQSGRYHLSCESDAKTLPTKAVVAQLRKTVTIDLEVDG